MMRPLIVVDGNSLAHANHNAPTLTVGDFQVQAIFGFLRSIRAVMKSAHASTQLLVLWDGTAQFRKDIWPDYKGNRAPLDAKQAAHKEAFGRQAPFIEKALELLGITQMRSPLLEADDLAGHLVPRAALQGRKVTLVTGDGDWLQLVHPNVTWFAPVKNQTVNEASFFEATGHYNTRSFVQGKALTGDNSDNIPGIPGMGDKTAAVFLAKWKSVESFFAAVDNGTYTPATRKAKDAKSKHPEEILASEEGRALFARNVQLMDFLQSRVPEKGEVIVKSGEPNIAGFTALCQRLNFQSILRELPSFLRDLNIEQPQPLAA